MQSAYLYFRTDIDLSLPGLQASLGRLLDCGFETIKPILNI